MVSAIASVLLGIAFLQLFKHQPHLMTKVTIASQVGLTLSCIWHLLVPLQRGSWRSLCLEDIVQVPCLWRSHLRSGDPETLSAQSCGPRM